MKSEQQQPKEYIITEKQVNQIQDEYPFTARDIRSRPHPAPAQQRTDEVIMVLGYAKIAGSFYETDQYIDRAIALLQAGRK